MSVTHSRKSAMTDIAIDAPLADTDDRAQRAEFFDRLKKTPTCMLITHDAGGAMHVRPMTTQQAEPDGIIWMFTSASGHLAAEVAANPGVLLVYSDTSDGAYAAVRGHAVLMRNIEKQRELWTALAGAWFHGGAEDPDLALLRITLSFAEQWEPTAGKVVQFLEIAAAALTKSVPESDGVYRRIDF